MMKLTFCVFIISLYFPDWLGVAREHQDQLVDLSLFDMFVL